MLQLRPQVRLAKEDGTRAAVSDRLEERDDLVRPTKVCANPEPGIVTNGELNPG
jgi:hypothetical protein